MSDGSYGPTCQVRNPRRLDKGTMAVVRHSAPGIVGARSSAADDAALEKALAALQAEAETFAWRFITDARARRTYVERIAGAARQLRLDVDAGVLSPAEAAKIANASRNVIMEEVRSITSAIGRAGAESAKASGLTLEAALDKAVKKLFPGKSFAELTALEERAVFMEVVEASGRSSARFTSQIPKWTRFGKGLAVVTVAISAYNIWEAKNKVRQGVKEGATLLGGALGGALADASAGFLCGPAAPGCVTVLFVIGGIAGALAAQSAADVALDQRVVVEWLGE